MGSAFQGFDLYIWILSSSFGEKVGERNIEAKFMEWTWDLIFIIKNQINE